MCQGDLRRRVPLQDLLTRAIAGGSSMTSGSTVMSNVKSPRVQEKPQLQVYHTLHSFLPFQNPLLLVIRHITCLF